MLEPTPLHGGNADFLDALYEQYLRDPASVDERWRTYFERIAPAGGERPHGPVRAAIVERARQPRAIGGQGEAAGDAAQHAAVSRLIPNWINRRHLLAKVDPLRLIQRPPPPLPHLVYFR